MGRYRIRGGSRPLFRRRWQRVALAAVSLVLVCLHGVVSVLAYWSYPGKPRPFMDEHGQPLPGSIAEKIRVNINGVEQAMFIKSKDTTHPVLLYLHGGLPDYFLTQQYPTGLEDAFTMVWWERRGIGLSYSPDIPRETLTSEQMIADILAVTDYLRQRFRQEKIYLMAHSEGTFIGIQAIARSPERYHAYIAVAQMTNQRKSEFLANQYMLQRFKDEGNTTMVRKLEAAPVTMAGGTPAAYLMVRDEAMHRLGIGTMHTMHSVVTGLFWPSLIFREYTIRDKITFWRSKRAAGVSHLWDEVMATNLSETVTTLDVPVYFLHGVYDYTVNYGLTKEYFGLLKAPVKGFYTFDKSAHSPNYEEAQKTLRILKEDVLTGAVRLADAT